MPQSFSFEKKVSMGGSLVALSLFLSSNQSYGNLSFLSNCLNFSALGNKVLRFSNDSGGRLDTKLARLSYMNLYESRNLNSTFISFSSPYLFIYLPTIIHLEIEI